MVSRMFSGIVMGYYGKGRLWLAGLAALCLLAAVSCGGGGGGGGGGTTGPPSDILHQSDGDGNGVIDMTYTYEHNAAGQIIMLSVEEGGLAVGFIEFKYDASGNCEQALLYDGGVLDTTIYFTYNTDGEVTLAEIDEGSNGTMDSCTESMYNVDGLLERREDDAGCNGSVERFKTFGWNGAGNLLWMEASDGAATDREDYTYDAAGNVTTVLYDDDDNGVTDKVDIVNWGAGAAGTENYVNLMYQDYGYFHPVRRLAPYRMARNLTSLENDEGDNGTIDSALYFYYGTDGRLSRIDQDEDYNGVIDRIEHFTW